MPASIVKQYLARFLDLTGYFSYRQRVITKRNTALILMYHRVLSASSCSSVPVQSGMYVTPKSLRNHLSYLQKHYNIISMHELIERIETRISIARCCVITFDDGWKDNYDYAFPLFREFGIPFTIFLATEYVGTTNWFWPEEVAWCLTRYYENMDNALLPKGIGELLKKFHMGNAGVEELIEQLIESLKYYSPEERDEIVQECRSIRRQIFSAENEGRLILNWEEISEMNESRLVSFGSHTASHVMLDQVQPNELLRQLCESMECLKKKISEPLMCLAYPNGNYTPNVIHTLSAFGYRAAVTTKRGFVQIDSPLYELPRFAIHDDVSHSQSLFKWRLFVR